MTPENLADPLWRLSHLYWIKTENEGRPIEFRPRPEQTIVIESLIKEADTPLYIVKSRRLGMSTAIGLTMGDLAAWSAGFQASLVDQTQSDAERKMAEIIRYGLLSMPPEIVERLEFPKRNDGELQIKMLGAGIEDISRVFAGKNARGGTNNFLWISEWGPISATDPTRSREIRTGALPSARLGRRVVETTWYGGKGGDLWEIVKPILERDPNAQGKLLFFPWHGDPACVRAEGVVDGELEEYFRELGDRLGRTFSPEQKKWYAAAKIEQGIFVKREYPSTLEEAMTAPVEGAIYAGAVSRARTEGRVRPFAVSGSALVHTFWDEGAPINTATWYAQFIGGEIHLVDFDFELNLTPVERTAHIKGKGYNLGNHYLTHASEQTGTSGKTFATQLTDAGLTNVRIVPRTTDIWSGINEALQQFPTMLFRLPACERGLAALENYHTRRFSASGIVSNEPVHDWSSHPADALRTLAEALQRGMVEGGSMIAKRSRRADRPVRVLMGFSDPMVAGRQRVRVVR